MELLKVNKDHKTNKRFKMQKTFITNKKNIHTKVIKQSGCGCCKWVVNILSYQTANQYFEVLFLSLSLSLLNVPLCFSLSLSLSLSLFSFSLSLSLSLSFFLIVDLEGE